jgi:hypothetical protein
MGDLHLLYNQYGRKERGRDFGRAALAMAAAIAERSPDLLCLAGDTFESTTIRPAAFEVARQVIDIVGCDTLIIPGNHDKAMFSQDKTWLEMLPVTVRVAALREPEIVYVGGVAIICLPYYGWRLKARLSDVHRVIAEQYDPNNREPLCLLGHFGLSEILPGVPSTVSAKEAWATLQHTFVDFMMVGHFHYLYGENNIFSAGAVARRTFDQPLGGCWFHEWDGGEWMHEYLGIESVHASRPFIEVHSSTFEDAVRNAKQAPELQGAVVRFVFHGDVLPSKHDLWQALEYKPLEIRVKDARSPIEYDGGTAVTSVTPLVERGIFMRIAGGDEQVADLAQQLLSLYRAGQPEEVMVRLVEEVVT